MSAARGVAALVVGNRRAPDYFDFSQRGLVGSFIAFIAVAAVNAALPTLLGVGGPATSIFRSAMTIAILFSFQLAFAALALRQLKRFDGFVPYLVADNWATFFVTLGASALAIMGISGDVALIVIGLLVIVIEVNIARLIVTLSILQIVMFLIAQLVGVSIGLIMLGLLLPLPPEVIEAMNAAQAQMNATQ